MKGVSGMKLSELLDSIDSIAEKEKYEKKKREIFNMREETEEELYIRSCGDEEGEM